MVLVNVSDMVTELVGAAYLPACLLGRFQGDKDDFLIGRAVDGETGRIRARTCEDEVTRREQLALSRGFTGCLGADPVVEHGVLRFDLRSCPGTHVGDRSGTEEVAKEAPLEEGESAGFFFRLREKWYQHRIGVQGDVHMCAKIICQRQHTG